MPPTTAIVVKNTPPRPGAHGTADEGATAAPPGGLKVLIVDDDPSDAELIQIELRRSDLAHDVSVANSRASFLRELELQPDVILSDFSMPDFGAIELLHIMRTRHLDTPVIIVSGTIGEDAAVEAMKLGAVDYLLKDRLTRLGSALGHVKERLRLNREKRAAESAHARLADIIETMPDLVSVIDAKGRPIYLNSAGYRMLGFDGKSLLDLPATPNSRTPWGADFPPAMQDGIWHGETVLRGAGGRAIPVFQTIIAHQDAAGRVERYSFIARDISAQKEAAARLEQSESLLHMAGRLGKIGAWIIELPDFRLTWTDEIRAIHEVPAEYVPTLEEGIGFYAPEYQPVIRQAVEACIRDGTPYDCELQIVTARGRRIWVRAIGEAHRADDGKIDRIQGAFQDIAERKEAAEQTRLMAERLSNTLESITDAFFTLDREWRFTYVNSEAERLLERSRDSLLGRCIWEEFMEARGTVIQTEYERALATRTAVHFETHYGPLGRWFEVHGYPSDQGIAVYFRDVSDHREAREALRASEERFRLLVQGVKDYAILMLDENGRVASWNAGVERLKGYRPEEILGRHFSVFYRQEDIAAGKPDLELTTAISDGRFEEDGWRVRKDGTQFWANVVLIPLYDEAHVLKGFAKVTRDVTEQRRAQARIAEQAALLDQANDAIVLRDLSHVVLYWSQGAERLYGWSKEQAQGRRTPEFLVRDRRTFDEAMRAVLSRSDWSGEIEHHTKTGECVTVAARWTLLRDELGQPKSVLAIDTDVTARKKVEAQFLRAQRLESIGTLAGGIAHDLNNLLSPIVMGVGLLKLSPFSPSDLRVLETIERSAARGTSLVRQVLSFARGAEGARVSLHLYQVLDEIKSIIANTFPKNIAFTSSVADDVALITGDPTQLNQVLLNLAVNARDAMPEGGHLSLRAENVSFDDQFAATHRGVAAGSYVVITVADTGAGIPREIIDKVFEPFFTTKELGKGTGLGLATAAGIVRSHGGFINVYSESGNGTVFKIYLPANQEAADEPLHSTEKVELPRGNGEWLLMVDDELSIRSITQQTLEAFGYHVLGAEDGAEAIGLFVANKEKISVVLTDIMMPVMDGRALIAAVRRVAPEIRIIAMSGLQTNGEALMTNLTGVSHFLTKPFSADVLLKTLRSVLSSTNALEPHP
jgi:PAS domain S-box-containing protein